jgi:hypothetical protein
MITSDLDSHIIEASSTTGAGGGRHGQDSQRSIITDPSAGSG